MANSLDQKIQELEKEKLEWEIRELKRKPGKLISSLNTIIPVFVSLATVAVLWYSGAFEFKRIGLEAQEHVLEWNNKKLRDEEAALISRIDKFKDDSAKLNAYITSLVKENAFQKRVLDKTKSQLKGMLNKLGIYTDSISSLKGQRLLEDLFRGIATDSKSFDQLEISVREEGIRRSYEDSIKALHQEIDKLKRKK